MLAVGGFATIAQRRTSTSLGNRTTAARGKILSRSHFLCLAKFLQLQCTAAGPTPNGTRIRTAGTLSRHDGACSVWHEVKRKSLSFRHFPHWACPSGKRVWSLTTVPRPIPFRRMHRRLRRRCMRRRGGLWLRYAALVFKPLVHWGKPNGGRRLRLTSCHSRQAPSWRGRCTGHK